MSYFPYQDRNIYYHVTGKGTPLLFLHGNTASARMFEPLLPLYQEGAQVILMDFLGHGRSDRIDVFPCTLWQEEALQAVALLEHLGGAKAHLVGTSGGAWVALHVALLRPDLVRTVVADSFDGRTLHEGFAEELVAERTATMADEQARQFYIWCQGEEGWEQVVHADTEALVQLAKLKVPLLPSLSALSVPLLLMGSLEDDSLGKGFPEEYRQIQELVQHAEIECFPTGGHPAILSNAEQVAEVVRTFVTANA